MPRVPDYGPGSISTKAKDRAMRLPRVPDEQQGKKTYGPDKPKKMSLLERLKNVGKKPAPMSQDAANIAETQKQAAAADVKRPGKPYIFGK